MKPEKTIQNEILRRYGTDPRMRLWRANVGAAVPLVVVRAALRELNDGRTQNAISILRTARPVEFGIKGQADLTGILPTGRRLEIEVKKQDGRTSPIQDAFGRMILSKHGVYTVARCTEDVDRVIAADLDGGGQ